MKEFRHGLKHGISIALGYLSVSFSFGIMAVQSQLTIWQAVLISITNLTSAGQVAGVSLIAAHASYFELFLAELVINIRYALMSLALSQKAHESFHLPQRLLASFGITDEIFAVSSIQPTQIKPRYLYGMILIAFLGWVGGTYLGAAAGTWLPQSIANALNISLYGMFLAIIIPPARCSRGIFIAVLLSAVLSTLLYYFADFLSSGFAMIICAVVAALIAAYFFPTKDHDQEESA